MAENYSGWRLFDKVIIVAKPRQNYVDGKWIQVGLQGYVVDPSNKTMLNNARCWGKWKDYNYRDAVEQPPEEFEFDNNDFTLELVDSADHSSQGGKLSFWNCNVTKDGQTFLVGIAADLLLDVLKNNTIINGKCQSPLMFARCCGDVGMLSTSMQSYQDALNDMELKKKFKTGKTTKHKIGHVYNTLTESDAYLADLYRWYEPICEKAHTYYGGTYMAVVGFRKLDKPVKLKWFASTLNGKHRKLSDFELHSWTMKEKIPARTEAEETIEYDISVDQCVEKYIGKWIIKPYEVMLERRAKGLGEEAYIDKDCVGLSTHGESYTMPDDVRDALIGCGYRIED